MKTLTLILLAGFWGLVVGCRPSSGEDPAPSPSFNQVNIALESSQITCLLNQWYNRTYHNEPIVFRVINDAGAYAAFFPCSLTTPLPAVDFTKNTLLIGMKADYGKLINSPVNISQINQQLTPVSDGNYALRVRVTGKASADSTGGQWFAFVSLVPKISGTVRLEMQYQFK